MRLFGRVPFQNREFFPRILRTEPRIVFAERNWDTLSIEQMMATGGDPVLIIIKPVHERLNRNGENVLRADQFFACPFSDLLEWRSWRAADHGTQFLSVQQRAIRHLVHSAIQ